jgi:hypothetical protein
MLADFFDYNRFAGSLGAWGPVVLLLGGLAALLIVFLLVAFLVGTIDYRITAKHLQVTLLGVPIRRLRLDNIRHISTRRPGFSERWQNHLFLKRDRSLFIEKRSGLIRHFLITPEQRFVFKAALDRAVRQVHGLPPAPSIADRMASDGLAKPAAPQAGGLAGEAQPEPRQA